MTSQDMMEDNTPDVPIIYIRHTLWVSYANVHTHSAYVRDTLESASTNPRVCIAF